MRSLLHASFAAAGAPRAARGATLALLAAALWLGAAGAWAQAGGASSTAPATSPPATVERRSGPPEGFVAPALPQPDESVAVREKTQPGNNAPFWRAVRESGAQHGTVNLPGGEKGTLIQGFTRYPGSNVATAGEAWRQVRNDWILPYGGALLVIVIVALGIFYFTKGPLGTLQTGGARRIERVTPFERAAHWTNAAAFVVLAVSGLVMAFGKFLLLPVLGATLFGWLAYALKTLHNVVGPLFVVSLLVVILTFVKDNFPQAGDSVWIRRGGGLFGGHEPPSHRFNAGEKLIFWVGVLLLGVTVVASGLVLDQLLPLENTRRQMQIAHLVHGTATAFMMAAFIGHIYMGTIGTRGAYRAMRDGYVDDAWAREHHALWYEDVLAGRVPAQRSGTPPPAGEAGLPPARPLAS
jgi:formate dehydrogenase subunit gamma